MPVGFRDGLLGTEFAARWESPRRRAPPQSEEVRPVPPRRLNRRFTCPHSMAVVRSSRQLAGDKKQCPICFEQYFDLLGDREEVIPVKLACQHDFCRECVEMHLSSSISCPLPWCAVPLPLQPDQCDLCAYWEKSHVEYLVLTVRAHEMSSSIRAGLGQLAEESHVFRIAQRQKTRLMSHVRHVLTQYEWQFHSGVDLAELLDPFLLAVDRTKARAHFGAKLSAPAPDPAAFPPRLHDPDDYPPGQEPWIAAYFRQWAMEYETHNGEVREGWGVQTKDEDDSDWVWPYKRILGHKTEADGRVRYLVKWVGQRFPSSWVGKEQLAEDNAVAYDKTHGIVHTE